MSSLNPANALTKRQINLCEYGGTFGILISLTCLVQHFIVVIPGRITNPMIIAYFFAIASFLLLTLQKNISVPLLIASAVLSLLVLWLWMTHYAFSVIVLVLFLYHIIIIVAAYAEQIPQVLKQKLKLKKAEEDFWAGRV